MRVLLTGAFGNLGSLVLADLLAAGHAVMAFDVPGPVNRKVARAFAGHARLTVVWGDIRDAAQVAALVRRQEAVVHLAAIIAPFSERNPELAFAVNVGGTQNLIDGVRASGASPLLVFASSFAVYGHRQSDPPPRTLADAVQATDHYSAHKIEGERRVQAMSTPWVILRLGAMIDARMRHSDREQARMGFRMAADNRVEYVHPQDVATAIRHALQRPAAHNRIHLIGGGPSCQVRHIDLMAATLGALGIRLTAADFGRDALYADWVDSREAEQLLDFQRHSLADFRAESARRFRWLRPCLRPLSPLLKRGLFRALGLPRR